MRNRKKIVKIWVASMLVVTLLLAFPYELKIGGGTILQYEPIQVEAASTSTFTIKTVDDKTSKKLHKKLLEGNAVTLKVKGNKKNSQKLLKDIVKKVGECNTYGIIFKYNYKNTKNGYSNYSVSKEYAQCYKYANELIPKMLDFSVRIIKDSQFYAVPRNCSNYSLQLEMLEQGVIEKKRYKNEYIYVYEEKRGELYIDEYGDTAIDITAYCFSDYYGNNQLNYIEDEIVYNVTAIRLDDVEGTKKYANDLYEKYYAYDVELEKEYIKLLNRYETKKFCDLKKREKMLLLSYGFCHYDSDGSPNRYAASSSDCECFIYYSTRGSKSRSQSEFMKLMLKGEARGVCSTFAAAASMLADYLGVKLEEQTEVNHVWYDLVEDVNGEKKSTVRLDNRGYGLLNGIYIYK